MHKKLLLVLLITGIVASSYFIYQRKDANDNENSLSWVEFVNSPQYLSACKVINPISDKQQVGFHDLMPGKTSLQQTVNLFGKPDQTTSFGSLRQLHYPGFTVNIAENSDLISEVHVFEAHEMNTLLSFIQKFGCPDLIYTLDEAEEPTGDFNSTYFYFSNIGLELFFAGFPVELGQLSWAISYYMPMPIKEYLTANIALFGLENKFKIVSWEQAVK